MVRSKPRPLDCEVRPDLGVMPRLQVHHARVERIRIDRVHAMKNLEGALRFHDGDKVSDDQEVQVERQYSIGHSMKRLPSRIEHTQPAKATAVHQGAIRNSTDLYR